jgi:hypothetical protein
VNTKWRYSELLLRLWLRLWLLAWRAGYGWRSRTGIATAAGISAARVNRTRKMIRESQFARRNYNEQFRILQRIASRPESIPGARNFREARQARNGVSVFHVGEPADQSRFFRFHADGLR